MLNQDFVIRLIVVAGFVLCLLYHFGFRDKFPYIGKSLWRERPFYLEVHAILMQQIERYSLGAELSEKTIERIDSTVDMVLEAFKKEYESIQVQLPNLDVGVQCIDFEYKVTRSEVANTYVERE